ncbi:MAG: hypothetical protein LBT92_02020, partial [Rickettsiales bacterium]|nr:hypothetical protein [Rickettsiales bacterium]
AEEYNRRRTALARAAKEMGIFYSDTPLPPASRLTPPTPGNISSLKSWENALDAIRENERLYPEEELQKQQDWIKKYAPPYWKLCKRLLSIGAVSRFEYDKMVNDVNPSNIRLAILLYQEAKSPLTPPDTSAALPPQALENTGRG